MIVYVCCEYFDRIAKNVIMVRSDRASAVAWMNEKRDERDVIACALDGTSMEYVTDPNLLARFTTEPQPREVRVSLQEQAAALADRFNAELGTTDDELMVLAWLIFSSLMEHTLAGDTITLHGGNLDGTGLDLIAMARYLRDQHRATGEIRTD